jgi:hypothetical protein
MVTDPHALTRADVRSQARLVLARDASVARGEEPRSGACRGCVDGAPDARAAGMSTMRTITRVFAFSAVALGALGAQAQDSAQFERLARAAEHAHVIAHREAPRTTFTAEVQELARAAEQYRATEPSPVLWMRLNAIYRGARRAMLASEVRPSDALLDAWDEVVVAWNRIGPRPPVPPTAVVPGLHFRGRTGYRDIVAYGRNHEELFADCERQMLAQGPAIGSDLRIGGTPVATRRRGVTPDLVCSIAVLSSTYVGATARQELLHGQIGQVPFTLRAPMTEAREIVYRYVPMIVEGMRVRRIMIEGRGFVNYRGYTPAGAVSLLDDELIATHPRLWYGKR